MAYTPDRDDTVCSDQFVAQCAPILDYSKAPFAAVTPGKWRDRFASSNLD